MTDTAQAAALIMEGKVTNGLITLGINWIPGFIAAIHLISVHRRDFKWYMTILYAVLLIVFYPIVPTLALLGMLWAKPSRNSSDKAFKDAEYKATIAQAIR